MVGQYGIRDWGQQESQPLGDSTMVSTVAGQGRDSVTRELQTDQEGLATYQALPPYSEQVRRGLVFTANGGTASSPATFAGAYDADGPDLCVDVPSGTAIMILSLVVHYEVPGTTLLLETFASAAGTLGAVTAGTAVTPRSNRVGGGGGASRTTVNVAVDAAGATVQSGELVEFARHGFQLDEAVTTGVDWPVRTFKWAAGVDGPPVLIIGDGSLFVHAASQAGTGFITATWAEFQNGEYS